MLDRERVAGACHDAPVAAVAPSQNVDVGPTSGPLFFAVAGVTLFAVSVDTSTPTPTGSFTVIGTVESQAIAGTGGQLYPCQIIVISPQLIFVLCPTGTAFLAAYGSAITSSILNPGGVGYAVGDTGAVLGGLIAAVYTVTGVSGSGAVTSYTLAGGTGYLGGNIYQTATGGVQPGVGIGFAIQVPVGNVAAAAWLVSNLNNSPLAPAFGGAEGDLFIQSATWLDGYVIIGCSPNSETAAQPNLNRTFFVSGLNNPNIWSPLDFGVKEANPDPLQAVFAAYEILTVFGLQTTELWQNTGNALFAFQRLPGGGVIDVGLASVWAIAKMDNSIVWLGMDSRGQYSAWMLQGSTPVRISSLAIENTWSNLNMNGASIYTYTEGGHTFAVFNFPVADQTWVWDSSVGPIIGWHERSTWNGSTFHADLGRYHGFANSLISGQGLHVVGDYTNGNLYLQGMQYLNENCNSIRRIRVCPHIVDEKKWHFYQRFRLHALTGLVASGVDPVFNLRISKDGAQTFGPYLDMPAGMAGQYEKMLDLWVHFRARDAVFEWSTSEQIDIVLVEAYIEHFAGTG